MINLDIPILDIPWERGVGGRAVWAGERETLLGGPGEGGWGVGGGPGGVGGPRGKSVHS